MSLGDCILVDPERADSKEAGEEPGYIEVCSQGRGYRVERGKSRGSMELSPICCPQGQVGRKGKSGI